MGCGERRRVRLRYFELPRSFVVLCHGCTAQAEALPGGTPPANGEELHMLLQREQRRGARRRGAAPAVQKGERRRSVERRVGARDLFDATDLAEEVPENLPENLFDAPIERAELDKVLAAVREMTIDQRKKGDFHDRAGELTGIFERPT